MMWSIVLICLISQFLLIRTTAFEKAAVGGNNASVEAVKLDTAVTASAASTFVSEQSGQFLLCFGIIELNDSWHW